MRTLLNSMARGIRRSPRLLKLARSVVFLIPDVAWTANVAPLGRLRIRLRRHRWFMYQDFRTSDAVMIAIFNRLVRPGDTVFDIGANIGVYTRFVVHALGAGKVVAFEPMSGNLELLRENVRLGDIEDRCQVLPVALGASDGEENLQIDDVTSGTAVLDSISGGQASQGRQHHGLKPAIERVRVRKLDTLMREGSLPTPAVMKIDTEGAEAIVLEGAIETLRAHRPRLTIALHGPDKALATLNVLERAGYLAFGAVRDEQGVRYRRLHAPDAERIANNNIVACAEPGVLEEPIRELVSSAAERVSS
jgi:FkbM family methyltransferase